MQMIQETDIAKGYIDGANEVAQIISNADGNKRDRR